MKPERQLRFNQRCAEQCLNKINGVTETYQVYRVPKHIFGSAQSDVVRVHEMRFHDSLDWASLLIAECAKGFWLPLLKKKLDVFMVKTKKYFYMELDPYLISRAALGILERK